MSSTLNLDIGAGASPKKGYKSVDLYAKADYQDDITKLDTFSDNSVDAVNTDQVLEHLSKSDVELALKQVFRILKPGGVWTITVPDLLWLFQDFLNTSEEKRWGWKIQTIFGLQNHPGEYHRTGFTQEHLGRLLKQTGFTKIKVTTVFSHHYNQGIIKAKAIKP